MPCLLILLLALTCPEEEAGFEIKQFENVYPGIKFYKIKK